MDIKNFADLAKLADTCRKKGIEFIKITEDGVEFRLGEKPGSRKRPSLAKTPDDIETENPYSDEDVLLWSANGAA